MDKMAIPPENIDHKKLRMTGKIRNSQLQRMLNFTFV